MIAYLKRDNTNIKSLSIDGMSSLSEASEKKLHKVLGITLMLSVIDYAFLKSDMYFLVFSMFFGAIIVAMLLIVIGWWKEILSFLTTVFFYVAFFIASIYLVSNVAK